MKEKDIVDFTKMKKDEITEELIDENGDEVGCQICYTHQKAYEKFDEEYTDEINVLPICPKCGERIVHEDLHVISEVNYSNPDGEIGYYPVFYCHSCQEYFAYMPIPITYNANHDIYYTGGRRYIEDDNQKKLVNDVFEAIKPNIEQYVRRVVDEKEKGLSLWNVQTWSERAVEDAVANWLYENNMKK